MNCRKCGAKQITRRSAGFFLCQHCGFQPGPLHLDRGGYPTRPPLEPANVETGVYQVAARQPRMKAGKS